MTDCRLYLITPPEIDLAAFPALLAAALDAGDVACLQLRLKPAPTDSGANAGTNADADAIRRATEALMPVCHARDVAFIVNDRPDLARQMGADGVHIGDDDGDFADARRVMGAEAIIGVSCYDSRQKAMDAGAAGADYVAFGAFFPTATKQAKARPEPEILRLWSTATTVPCVAIGGVTAENCGVLVAAGADFLAVINGVWGHEDGPAAAVSGFGRAIAAAAPE